MTIEIEAGTTAGLSRAGKEHGHRQAHDRGHARDGGAPGAGFSAFLASALDRLALAALLAGIVWIGVFWAVR